MVPSRGVTATAPITPRTMPAQAGWRLHASPYAQSNPWSLRAPCVDRSRESAGRRGRSTPDQHAQCGPGRTKVLLVWHEDLGARRLRGPALSDVPDDADDGHRTFLVIARDDRAADRILIAVDRQRFFVPRYLLPKVEAPSPAAVLPPAVGVVDPEG
jgi:hypothetical protein